MKVNARLRQKGKGIYKCKSEDHRWVKMAKGCLRWDIRGDLKKFNKENH